MINVIVAFWEWGNWENAEVKIFCDNAAVIDILNNGLTRDLFLSVCSFAMAAGKL